MFSNSLWQNFSYYFVFLIINININPFQTNFSMFSGEIKKKHSPKIGYQDFLHDFLLSPQYLQVNIYMQHKLDIQVHVSAQIWLCHPWSWFEGRSNINMYSVSWNIAYISRIIGNFSCGTFLIVQKDLFKFYVYFETFLIRAQSEF